MIDVLLWYLGIATIIYFYSAAMGYYDHYIRGIRDSKFPITSSHTHQFMAVISIFWIVLAALYIVHYCRYGTLR